MPDQPRGSLEDEVRVQTARGDMHVFVCFLVEGIL